MSEMNYEMISQYLDGALSGEELRAFEAQMNADAELAAEVQLQRTIREEMMLHARTAGEEAALKKSLQQLTQQHFDTKPAAVRRINRWWYVAATAAAAAILLFILKPFAKTAFDSQKEYAYYSGQREDLSVVQRGDPADSILLKAAELYNKQDYNGALPLLLRSIEAAPADMQLQLAAGYSYLQTGNTREADSLFEKIAAGNSVYKYEAVWYKALSLLKADKKEECAALLHTLPEQSSRYASAKELLKKMKR